MPRLKASNKLKIEDRCVTMYFRTRPKVKQFFETCAEENHCTMVDVLEEIAELFAAGRIEITDGPLPVPAKLKMKRASA